MPHSSHDTTAPAVLPTVPPDSQDWEQEVLPRLPPGWQEQAKRLKAFSRTRQLRSAADVLRGILAHVLCARSFRHLGCWSVLVGLADISEAAWRARGWPGWSASCWLSPPAPPPGWCAKGCDGCCWWMARI